MKKTKKRILGFLGLVLVVITTIFAAFLPGPETSAIISSSATDLVLVRVVNDVPDVQITSPANGSVFVIPDQTLSVSYENMKNVVVSIEYTDKDDQTHEYTLDSFDSDYEPGSRSYDIDLLGSEYGYGRYLAKITGDSYNLDVADEDIVEFFFYPVYGEAEEDESDGLIYLDLYYDTESDNISTIGINIYDENGDLVEKISPIMVQSPGTRVELPFSENNLPEGNYSIGITAYNENGDELYLPYYTSVYYKPVLVPDTGATLVNFGISKTDYLIISVTIFMLVAIMGIVFVAKGREQQKVSRG